MGAGAGVVSDPDTEVLDLQRALLMNLGNSQISMYSAASIKTTHHIQADDLSVRLLDLS